MSERWNRADALRLRGIIDRMSLCCCGTDAHWECVKELLERAENHEEKGNFYSFLPETAGEVKDSRDPWLEFGAKVLDSWDLLQHGGSIGYAFLSEDGQLLLRFLRDFGLDSQVDEKEGAHWPLWAVELSWNEEPKENDSFSKYEREFR